MRLYKLVKDIGTYVDRSNYCFMNVFEDRIPGRAIIISVVSVASIYKLLSVSD